MTAISIGHSPDPDDAYMFYAVTHGKLPASDYEFDHRLESIESLNVRALLAELDITAISAALYPLVADEYRILDSGISMGVGYGPILVARSSLDPAEIKNSLVAIPGRHTTAALLLRIYCGEPSQIEVAFDEIPATVQSGRADVGLLIHEGQITYASMGLQKVLDLGEQWREDTLLPLPLGINVVRRSLGDNSIREISRILRDSIDYARSHQDEALTYAMSYGRGIDEETCRRFVNMYVNDYTLALGHTGREALERLYEEAFKRQLIERMPPVDVLPDLVS